MKAAYARHHSPGEPVAHLILNDDDDRALCGTQRGDPAPAVTCGSCAGKWTYSIPEGKRAAKAARQEFDMLLLSRAMGAAPPPPRPQQVRCNCLENDLKRRAAALRHILQLARLLGADLQVRHPGQHGERPDAGRSW